ncbi:MAG: uncharacterized protein JWO98_804 [Frankiales bacterium]|nr:uncharacterized protein [Frankiales bacterium]
MATLRCVVLRWTLGLVVAAVLSAFAALLIHGQYFDEGPVILTISSRRAWGVHSGDLFIAGGWLVGVIAVLTLVVDRCRPPS